MILGKERVMGTKSVYTCAYCKRPILKFDLVSGRPIYPKHGVKHVNGNRAMWCPTCEKYSSFGDWNPLSLG